MKRSPHDVIEIVRDYLERNGFDGLCHDQCKGCTLGDLMSCNTDCSDCQPGYSHFNINQELDSIEQIKPIAVDDVDV